jgi:hypothetical protein
MYFRTTRRSDHPILLSQLAARQDHPPVSFTKWGVLINLPVVTQMLNRHSFFTAFRTTTTQLHLGMSCQSKAQLSNGVSPQEFEPPWLLLTFWSYDRVVKVFDSKALIQFPCCKPAWGLQTHTHAIVTTSFLQIWCEKNFFCLFSFSIVLTCLELRCFTRVREKKKVNFLR